MYFYIIPEGVRPCRNALEPLYSGRCGMNYLIELTWGTKRMRHILFQPHCVINSDNIVGAFT